MRAHSGRAATPIAPKRPRLSLVVCQVIRWMAPVHAACARVRRLPTMDGLGCPGRSTDDLQPSEGIVPIHEIEKLIVPRFFLA